MAFFTEMLNPLVFVVLSCMFFFLLQIGILMSELNNIWRDVHRGPPDPFLVIGYQSFSLISDLQVKSIIKLTIDLYLSNIPNMVT